MKPLGAKGSRKVQDILTDLHVPAWRKAATVLVTMREAPIWIAGMRISDDLKLTADTRRVLRLRYVPGKGSAGD